MSPDTYLYLPATRVGELLAKAVASADAVVIDLEDAVRPDEREAARREIARHLTELPVPIDIRVNAVSEDDFLRDVEVLSEVAPLVSGVRLPKVGSVADIDSANRALDGLFDRAVLVCQLESARAVADAFALASAPGVQSIMLGESDLRADLGLPRDEERGLDLARQTVVLASRAAGLPSPIGSVFPRLDDVDGLRSSTQTLRAMGFHGRSCIHPRQIPVVREVYAPRDEDVAWAERVLAVADAGASAATTLGDGSFVDPAIEKQARAILRRRGAPA